MGSMAFDDADEGVRILHEFVSQMARSNPAEFLSAGAVTSTAYGLRRSSRIRSMRERLQLVSSEAQRPLDLQPTSTSALGRQISVRT